MSHYSMIKTQFKAEHIDCLIEALAHVGGVKGRTWDVAQIERHADAQPLFGYQGDKRAQSAHVIIPGRGAQRARKAHNVVGGASNDLGFEIQDDGTVTAHISDYDRSQGYRDEWLNSVSQRYARNVVIKTKPRGYRVAETVDADGSVVVNLVKA